MAKKTQKQIVAILQETYPKINKFAASMANHPEKYGVCFTKEAKEILGMKQKKPNRKKSCQLTVRVEPAFYDIIKRLQKEYNLTTQTMLEQALAGYCHTALCLKEIMKEEIECHGT